MSFYDLQSSSLAFCDDDCDEARRSLEKHSPTNRPTIQVGGAVCVLEGSLMIVDLGESEMCANGLIWFDDDESGLVTSLLLRSFVDVTRLESLIGKRTVVLAIWTVWRHDRTFLSLDKLRLVVRSCTCTVWLPTLGSANVCVLYFANWPFVGRSARQDPLISAHDARGQT